MKITASRKDDLIAERDAYDAETMRYRGMLDQNEAELDKAQKYRANLISDSVAKQIGETPLNLDINTYLGWDNCYRVTIACHDNDKFSDDAALSWNWEATIKDGEVAKDSGSWSGLKAITQNQIDDLKESVRVLEILNNLDWKLILSIRPPKYADYVDSETSKQYAERRQNRKPYEDLIKEAEVEDLIGSDNWIKVRGAINSSYNPRYVGEGWVHIKSATPQYYLVNYLADHNMRKVLNGDISVDEALKYTEKCKKSTFNNIVMTPIKTVEVK